MDYMKVKPITGFEAYAPFFALSAALAYITTPIPNTIIAVKNIGAEASRPLVESTGLKEWLGVKNNEYNTTNIPASAIKRPKFFFIIICYAANIIMFLLNEATKCAQR